MRRIDALTASLLLIAMAGGAAAEPGTSATPTAVAESATPSAVLREVKIDPNAKPLVCRRYVPTGSRIATRVCEAPRDSLTATEQTDRDTLRREFAQMRELQTMRRAQAQAEALRRATRQ